MFPCVCGVLGHLTPVHRRARSVCCLACAVSWATWLLFTVVVAPCVVLCVRCPRPLGSSSAMCALRVWCCVACAVSWATWFLFTRVPARCVVLRVRCPGPLGSCSAMCALGVLCCVALAASWATWFLFTRVPARCVVLRVRCPGPLGSCSLLCPLRALRCVCDILGHLAPAHWSGSSLCRVASAVSWVSWLLSAVVLFQCFVLCVRCPSPLGSGSAVCPLGVLCRVCSVLGHLAPVHRCARQVYCLPCAVSWATWLLFSGVLAKCAVLLKRYPEPHEHGGVYNRSPCAH